MLLYSKFCKFLDERSQLVSNIYGAAGMTMMLISPAYLIWTAVLYKYETTPNIFMAECNATTPYMDCSPPHDSHLCQDETKAFIVKIVVFSIAIIVEMVVAVLIVKNDTENGNRFDRKCLNILVKISKTFLLWNVFVFIHTNNGRVSFSSSLYFPVNHSTANYPSRVCRNSLFCTGCSVLSRFAAAVLWTKKGRRH